MHGTEWAAHQMHRKHTANPPVIRQSRVSFLRIAMSSPLLKPLYVKVRLLSRR
jgi:hypothetical protein